MPSTSRDIEADLLGLGFRRFATLIERNLTIDSKPPSAPGVYVAVLDGAVFWVGQTGNLRARFDRYRTWLALPDDSSRADRPTRDQLLHMVSGRPLTFYWKEPIQVHSELTGRTYFGHQVEEAMLIDHFQPAWNLRKGGRRHG